MYVNQLSCREVSIVGMCWFHDTEVSPVVDGNEQIGKEVAKLHAKSPIVEFGLSLEDDSNSCKD